MEVRGGGRLGTEDSYGDEGVSFQLSEVQVISCMRPERVRNGLIIVHNTSY
jgi:hypothetical protein